MQVTATLRLDDVYATFIATAVPDDYGVPGSPRWTSYEDIKLESLEVLDTPLPLAQIPDALEAKLLEQADDLEWEPDE